CRAASKTRRVRAPVGGGRRQSRSYRAMIGRSAGRHSAVSDSCPRPPSKLCFPSAISLVLLRPHTRIKPPAARLVEQQAVVRRKRKCNVVVFGMASVGARLE